MNMKIDKQFITQNLITICCVIALVCMFLPFLSIDSSASVAGVSASASQSVSGFEGVGMGAFGGIVLLAGPALLIVMNYIKQIEKYRGLLAIGIPALCIVMIVVNFFWIKSLASAGGDMAGEIVGMGIESDTSATPGIGMILMIVAYLGAIVGGAINYHGLKLTKEGIKNFKLNTEALGDIKGDLSNLTSNIPVGKANATANTENNSSSGNSGTSQQSAGGASAPAKRKANISKADEVIALIERLAKMKTDGILSDEEFAEKKKQLLDEI